jgi:hypothetical protein
MSKKFMPNDPVPPWRVGVFVSSACSWKHVVMVAVGDEEIAEYGAHRDFVRWLTPDPHGVSVGVEPIPPRVYWAPLADNFYDADGKGQGTEFYRKWKPRRAEFPQGESYGWGPGMAHNPFKDAPRPAGVPPCEGSQR